MVMSACTRIERSGPAIRAVLAERAPRECTEFEAELRQALADAITDLDLSRVDAVLDRWWGVAHLRANPLSDGEKAVVERAHEGDFSGLRTRDRDGNWVTL